MPEYDVFSSAQDHLDLALFILSQGAALIPFVFYDKPQFEEIKTGAEFVHFNRKTDLFFVTHPSFSELPISFLDVERDEGIRYWIDQRSGGPGIIWRSPPLIEQEELTLIPSDSLMYHYTFWSPVEETQKKAPKTIGAFYKKIIRKVQETGAEVKTSRRTYWATQAALRKRNEGAYFVGVDI